MYLESVTTMYIVVLTYINVSAGVTNISQAQFFRVKMVLFLKKTQKGESFAQVLKNK